MRLLPLLAAATLVATPAFAAPRSSTRPAAAQNWLTTIVATPEGGFRIGNPAAKVKIIEYGSLTCSHCRAFQQGAMGPLRQKYIPTGKVSFEYRNFVRNGPDYAASLLASCDGPGKFFDRTDALFVKQDEWVKPFAEMTPETSATLAKLPPAAQIGALAKAGGLDTFMRTRGMAPARIDACLADKAAQDRLTAGRDTAIQSFKIDGTPGLVINGERQTTEPAGAGRGLVTWDELEPRIVAALR